MTPGVDFFGELERAIRELTPKPKMLVIGFPSNPTAQCVDLDFFERIVALARQHNILVVHDLAYADIVFDSYKAPSIMQVPGARDVAVEFFTMSKSYNMAGWRIGFMVGNRDLVHALARIKSYHDYGSFTPIQVASIVALEGPQDCVSRIRATYEKRRDVMVKGLHDIGWRVEMPKASMYIWAKIPERLRRPRINRVHQAPARRRQDRGGAGHRLRRLRRRPCAHRSHRERPPPAPGGARHPRHVQKGRTPQRSGVIRLQPATLEGHGVRLEPLDRKHHDGLAAAAQDGRLWELWFTSVPAPGETAAYIDTALQGRRTGTCCLGWWSI